MKFKAIVCTIALALLGFHTAVTAQSMKDAAAALPGDVVAAFFVGDVKKTDENYRTVIDRMGLKDIASESERYPLKLLKEKLPGLTGFDDNGSLALVILKSASLPEIMTNVAVLLPASDSARLLSDLGGDPVKPDDDRVRSVLLFGQTMYAAATAKHVAVAKSAEVARASQQKANLGERLTAHEIASLQDLDAAIWLDTAAIITIFKPQIDGLMSWALMMQMGAGEVGEEEARASKKQIDAIVEGLTSLLLGGRLSEQGVGLRFTASTKPGSELASQTRHVLTTGPLLQGLPRRSNLLAFGQQLHSAAIHSAITTGLDPVFADLRKEEGIDKEKLAAIQKQIAQSLEMIHAVRGSIDHLRAGTDGMIAASLILEVDDSAAWLNLAQKAGADLVSLLIDAAEEEDAEMAEEALKWVTWKPEGEQLEGVSVSHLAVDILADEELEEYDRQVIKVIIGPGPLTLRMGAADAKRVALTLGGGSAQMARLIRAIRSGRSPLDEDAGVIRAAAAQPRERAGVAYLAVDRVVHFIDRISEECEEEAPFPIWIPPVDAPLAFSVTGGDGWSRHNLFAPMPLLEGIVTGVRTMELSEESEDDSESEADDENSNDDE